MSQRQIGFVVGSLRAGSFNRKLAQAVVSYFPANWTINFLEIGNLPFYNEDIDVEGKTPDSYTAFRQQVAQQDAFVFFTPEYNRSVPAALKNALDVASRPYGQNVWAGKPAGVISSSLGALGGYGANHILRETLDFLAAPVLQQPEMYLGSIYQAVDESGNISDPEVLSMLEQYATEFVKWVNLVSPN